MPIGHRNNARVVRASFGFLIAAVAGGAVAATHVPAVAGVFATVENAMNCAEGTACVTAVNSRKGPAVSGTSAEGIGIVAKGTTGLAATGTSGITASATTGIAVVGTSTGGTAVSGITSTGTSGVFGESMVNYGVYGTTTTGVGSGVVGYASNAGTGVWGQSVVGDGVEAQSQVGTALSAQSAGGTAIYASAPAGTALVATSGAGEALYASNAGGGVAGYFQGNVGGQFSGQGNGIIASANAPSGIPLELTDQNLNELVYADAAGNFYIRGTYYTFTPNERGTVVKSFGARTAQPTIEDTGTAQLVGGVASVALDRTFAASIDTTRAYRVFLTPDGDTRGLLVAAKTPTGFVVRETQGGRSTLGFDYRIVADAFGEGGRRMSVTGLPSRPLRPKAPKLPAAAKAFVPLAHP